jgi:hypothetical protein
MSRKSRRMSTRGSTRGSTRNSPRMSTRKTPPKTSRMLTSNFNTMIGGIISFLPKKEQYKLLRVNKMWNKKVKDKLDKDMKTLQEYIDKHFVNELIHPGIDTKSFQFRITDMKMNPTTKLLLSVICKHVQTPKYVTLIRPSEWVLNGHCFRVGYKQLSMGYRAELVYFTTSETFDVVLGGGSNGMDADYNANKISKMLIGKLKTIYEALDIINDEDKRDKCLRN